VETGSFMIIGTHKADSNICMVGVAVFGVMGVDTRTNEHTGSYFGRQNRLALSAPTKNKTTTPYQH
jgi:hypothetical protein